MCMSLLDQNTALKGQVEISRELNKGNSKESKFKAIYDSEIYVKESDNFYLPDPYDLVL